jgi:hypothetical protein
MQKFRLCLFLTAVPGPTQCALHSHVWVECMQLGWGRMDRCPSRYVLNYLGGNTPIVTCLMRPWEVNLVTTLRFAHCWLGCTPLAPTLRVHTRDKNRREYRWSQSGTAMPSAIEAHSRDIMPLPRMLGVRQRKAAECQPMWQVQCIFSNHRESTLQRNQR